MRLYTTVLYIGVRMGEMFGTDELKLNLPFLASGFYRGISSSFEY